MHHDTKWVPAQQREALMVNGCSYRRAFHRRLKAATEFWDGHDVLVDPACPSQMHSVVGEMIQLMHVTLYK